MTEKNTNFDLSPDGSSFAPVTQEADAKDSKDDKAKRRTSTKAEEKKAEENPKGDADATGTKDQGASGNDAAASTTGAGNKK